VKFFWPNRAKARGFSIENLSLQYREKTDNFSSIEIQNQCTIDSTLRSKNKVINYVESCVTSRKKNHWANRDFSEYEEVA
tara:strand:- start:285 stop:524 length:240 start_codon:yes stop_codon:yes gene_type:complete